ncbi:MAG: UDP-glucose 4-epimerase [Candidatus Fermentimicrarchaeum limneticum]|uniref:UDP-glucose 4-epimerase n=1 Tax=Fermentimicrarchaeum limneticum TaxID=2795018 RepID=A0A7D5XIE1_FERL1|nr:MAG: UDP-glucose 4-epimerase [Candidatus Fermentimicrarchaeum limneticum]
MRKKQTRKKPQKPSAGRKPLMLVTGAGGRLGKHLLRLLLERNSRVRVLARAGADLSFPEGVEVFPGDITHPSTIMDAVNGVDVVFHLAALVDYVSSEKELFRVNVDGTRNLLKVCVELAPHLKRFVYCSSTSVMGKEPAEIPANEKTECIPTDNYGLSKLMAEKVVMEYRDRLPVTIIRPAVIYGEGFNEGYFPVFKMLKNHTLRILDSGRNVLPFIHARDVARALLLAAENKKAVGQTYVITGGEQMTQKEIMEIAAKELGVKPPTKHIPRFMAELGIELSYLTSIFGGKKPSIDSEQLAVLSSHRVFDISKAKKELGYAPEVRLEEGIKEMVEYYKRGAFYEEHGKGGKIHK